MGTKMKDQKFYDRLKLRLDDSERFLTILKGQIYSHGQLHEKELSRLIDRCFCNNKLQKYDYLFLTKHNAHILSGKYHGRTTPHETLGYLYVRNYMQTYYFNSEWLPNNYDFQRLLNMLNECEDEKFLYMFEFFERIYVHSPALKQQFYNALQRRSEIINCYLRIDMKNIHDGDEEYALERMIEIYEKEIEEYEKSASEEFGKLNYVKADLVLLKSEIFRQKPDYFDIKSDGFLDENGFIWKSILYDNCLQFRHLEELPDFQNSDQKHIARDHSMSYYNSWWKLQRVIELLGWAVSDNDHVKIDAFISLIKTKIRPKLRPHNIIEILSMLKNLVDFKQYFDLSLRILNEVEMNEKFQILESTDKMSSKGQSQFPPFLLQFGVDISTYFTDPKEKSEKLENFIHALSTKIYPPTNYKNEFRGELKMELAKRQD